MRCYPHPLPPLPMLGEGRGALPRSWRRRRRLSPLAPMLFVHIATVLICYRTSNRLEYNRKSLKHVVVCETKNAPSVSSQAIASSGILGLVRGVNFTIEFYDQLVLRRTEIEDETADRVLPAELHTALPSPSQSVPQNALSVRLVMTKDASGSDQLRAGVANPSRTRAISSVFTAVAAAVVH